MNSSQLVRRLRGWLKPSREPDTNIKGVANDIVYLRRWYLIPRNPIFNIYYHEFKRSDDDRALHDHPWWSLSLVTHGFMREIDAKGERLLHFGMWRFRRGKYAHRLILQEDMSAETLFITGPRFRHWGFHCPQGWVHWKVFLKDGKGCG